MYNRRYDKAFVMLRQETNGFALGQRPAWGSSVMEIKNGKGRLTVSIQGIKKLTDSRNYIFYIIGGKLGVSDGILCGEVEVDDYGRGELKWDFDPENVGGTGYTIEEIHTLALLVKGKANYGLTAPLAGYFNEKRNWQKHFREYRISAEKEIPLVVTKVQPEEIKIIDNVQSDEPENVNDIDFSDIEVTEGKEDLHAAEATLILEDEPEIEEKKVSKIPFIMPMTPIEPIQEQVESEEIECTKQEELVKPKEMELPETEPPKMEQEETDFQKNFKDLLSNFHKELQDLETKGVLPPEYIQQIEKAGDQADVTQGKNNEIDNIFLTHTTMEPFFDDDILWKCISMEELVLLPVDCLFLMKQNFYRLAYRKFKHYLLGKKEGEYFYFLGIPDIYHPENKLLAEKLGFFEFKPFQANTLEEGSHGYWIQKISSDMSFLEGSEC